MTQPLSDERIAATVREIVAAYLREQEFDGLVHPNADCSCTIDTLMACYPDWGDSMAPCEPHVPEEATDAE